MKGSRRATPLKLDLIRPQFRRKGCSPEPPLGRIPAFLDNSTDIGDPTSGFAAMDAG